MTEKRNGAFSRVYDSLRGSKKLALIPRSIRAEAIGTWTLALAYCNSELSDGYVPPQMIEELAGTEAGAEALVAAGLWRRRRGGGFVFVNYAEHQTTRAEVLAKRAANNERQQRHRNKGGGDESVTRDSAATNAQSESTTETKTETSQSSRKLPAAIPQNRPTYPQGESFDQIAAALDGVLADTDDPLDSLTVRLVADHVLGRAKRAPSNPTRYVLRAIETEPEKYRTFARTGSWPSE